MVAGRPTIYGQSILDKTAAYIDGGYDVFPSIAGLALELGISRDTIHTWIKDPDKKEFSDIIDRLQALQEKTLLKNGLLGTYNPTITKVVLTKHGYSDKQETALTGANGGAIKTETVLPDSDRDIINRYLQQKGATNDKQ